MRSTPDWAARASSGREPNTPICSWSARPSVTGSRSRRRVFAPLGPCYRLVRDQHELAGNARIFGAPIRLVDRRELLERPDREPGTGDRCDDLAEPPEALVLLLLRRLSRELEVVP